MRLRSVLLAYLRRFAVRAPCLLGTGLFWATGAPKDSGQAEARPWPSPHAHGGVLATPALRDGTDPVQLAGSPARSRPPAPTSGDTAVQEC